MCFGERITRANDRPEANPEGGLVQPTSDSGQPSGPGSGSNAWTQEGWRMTEAQLIRQACEGNGSAVRALYERFSPRVYAVVRRIAGEDDLAQDYAQEAWIRAIRALPTFRGDARFSTWLHRIAVNSALQALRKADTRTKREAPMPESIPVNPEGGDTLLGDLLERAMDQLPDGMRQVLILHDVEGYTHEEIGELLGVTSGTSKSQLFKARAKMRDLLQPTLMDGTEGQQGVEAWGI
jgi:RNA polymerase sigma-70 factor (ECF subfamily)